MSCALCGTLGLGPLCPECHAAVGVPPLARGATDVEVEQRVRELEAALAEARAVLAARRAAQAKADPAKIDIDTAEAQKRWAERRHLG